MQNVLHQCQNIYNFVENLNAEISNHIIQEVLDKLKDIEGDVRSSRINTLIIGDSKKLNLSAQKLFQTNDFLRKVCDFKISELSVFDTSECDKDQINELDKPTLTLHETFVPGNWRHKQVLSKKTLIGRDQSKLSEGGVS
jgi:hypothetical protein